jgi:hypothetical protein
MEVRILVLAAFVVSAVVAFAGNVDLLSQRMIPGQIGVLGDLTGDGIVDRLVTTTAPIGVPLYLDDGAGGFVASNTVAVPGVSELIVADFDYHGEDDAIIVIQNGVAGSTFAVVHGSGTGLISVTLVSFPGIYVSALCAGDFTGDGVFDVLGTASPNLLTFAGNGAGRRHGRCVQQGVGCSTRSSRRGESRRGCVERLRL